MEKQTFNWGIIGPGRIANKFAESLSVVKGTKLHSVASNNLEKAELFIQKYNGEKAYHSYEDIVNDNDVDAIYIATPHRFHYEQTKLALESGKPVLCEKPFTVNYKQAKELFDLAKSKKLFLMEALWTRYLPIFKKVKTLINEGKIGEIKFLSSTFGFTFPRNESDRILNHELAGGTLLDMGVYPIGVSQFILDDDPIEVSANSMIGNTNVDEFTSITLKYNNNIFSQFTSNVLVKTNNDFIIYGTKGQITIHPDFWASTKATIKISEKESVITEGFNCNGFEYQIEEATNCIKKGMIESSIMTHKNTLANMELMDKIREKIGLKYTFE